MSRSFSSEIDSTTSSTTLSSNESTSSSEPHENQKLNEPQKHKKNAVDYDVGYIESEKELFAIAYSNDVVAKRSPKTLGFSKKVLESSAELETPQTTPETGSSHDEELEVVDDDDEPAELVRVTFRTESDATMSTSFKSNWKIRRVKERLSKVFNVPVEHIILKVKAVVCLNTTILSELVKDISEGIEFDIQSDDPRKYITPGDFTRYKPIQNVTVLPVPQEIDRTKFVVVKVEQKCFVKQWLGGYRNCKTNVEYHNAMAQTIPLIQRVPKASRETQTPVFPFKDIGTDMSVHVATQMWRSDCNVTNANDKFMIGVSKRFVPVRNNWLTFLPKVLLIQRYFRRYLKRRESKKLQELVHDCETRTEMLKEERITELWAGNRNLILGTVFPISRSNFYLMYLLIGKWWRNEMKLINETKKNASRNAVLYNLLLKEVELLRVIENQRSIMKKECLLRNEMHFVDTTSRPIVFRNNKGLMSSIDTLETQQAREYHEIYSSYMSYNLSKVERINILLMLKELIKRFTDLNPYELIRLLDRECDLLTIGLTDDQLKGHRSRVQQLMLRYLHVPEINPNCKKYRKPGLPKTDYRLYKCIHCAQLKPASDFNVHVRMDNFSMCHSCEWLTKIGCGRVDITVFKRLLCQVRESEMANCCTSSFCYVLQPVGMGYLMSQIWFSKSILSDHNDTNDLRFTRFYRNEDWSPWNCILLTLEESFIHLAMEDVECFYGKRLMEIIRWRHLRAKMHFLPLILNDRFMHDTKLWTNIKDTGTFLHPSHIDNFAQHDDFEFIS